VTSSYQLSRRQLFAAAFASVAGFSFDLFDLFVLLFVASTIGPLLFPSSQPTLSLAAVYGSFAVSLIMRPVGSFAFGPHADRIGRKRLMIITISGVGLATALMGAVPTYAQAGAAAPAAFLFLRLVQGLFVGGVVASTHTIATESIPEKWRGLMSGIISGGAAAFGAVVASVADLVIHIFFPGSAFGAWGWRIMFYLGIFGALLSFFVLRAVEESPLWRQQVQSAAPARAPVKTLFRRRYLGVVLLNLVVVSGAGAQYYLTSGYLPTFFAKINGLSGTVTSRFLIWDSLVFLISTLLVGHLSEHIGRKKTFLLTGAVNIVALPVLYWQLSSLGSASTYTILACSLLLVFFSNAAYAPVLIFLNERFPTAVRSTGTAFCWNGGFAIGGLMTTFVSLASPTIADIPSRLIFFLIGWIVIFIIAILASPETRGRLTGLGSEQGIGAVPLTGGT